MQDTQDNQTAKPQVAVVDDDPSFLRSIGRMLRIAGYDVSSYKSPGDFLNSLPGSAPRCLVVDMHMPEMTGIELQERLLAGGFAMPAILVTAHDTPQTREQARRRGFAELLLKPFDGEVLLAALAKLSAEPAPAETANKKLA